ncbi:MAG TPA: hypothetical protein DIU15_14920 [Deltaproteobacteria bacterium]|nr:hypothetical protein [Deltaproteobacteria bacterium]HCP47332.1 hypothetical protein [Deltaproteobacteria bacterium]
MSDWRRLKAIRHLTWVAIGLCVFPGAFFMLLSGYVTGWTPESLLAFYPALIVGGLAFALHGYQPTSPPVMRHWRPETELLAPLPRSVELRWSTPRVTMPMLLWLIPAFYLVMVLLDVRLLHKEVLLLLSLLPILATIGAALRRRSPVRSLLSTGQVAKGLIRRIVTGNGVFRLKVEYEFDGESFFHWTDNLSPNSWFGPLFAEEALFVTLLVDPDQPRDFVVYRFCDHEVASDQPAWTRRAH